VFACEAFEETSMEMVIVAAVIVVALGAYATFTLADLLPQDVLAKNETHGRFAHLGEETEPAPEPAPLHGRGRGRTPARAGALYRRRGRGASYSRNGAGGRRLLRNPAE
jgi:hypothetical protein